MIVIAVYILGILGISCGSKLEMSTVVTEKPRETTEAPATLESVRRQILSFGTQIHEYLTKVEANVEDYKFNVQKKEDGVEVEVEFKAMIRPKHTSASKIISK